MIRSQIHGARSERNDGEHRRAQLERHVAARVLKRVARLVGGDRGRRDCARPVDRLGQEQCLLFRVVVIGKGASRRHLDRDFM